MSEEGMKLLNNTMIQGKKNISPEGGLDHCKEKLRARVSLIPDGLRGRIPSDIIEGFSRVCIQGSVDHVERDVRMWTVM
ncbi:hypothetical protein ACLOJK_003508 [Asimina triloba]